jgi:hypothetical protein
MNLYLSNGKIKFDLTGWKEEIEHNEGGVYLVSFLFLTAFVGFNTFYFFEDIFNYTYQPLFWLVFYSPTGLTLFFALMAISLKATIKEQGMGALLAVTVFAALGAIGPFLSYNVMNYLTGYEYPIAGGLTGAATDVLFARACAVLSGAGFHVIQFIGQVGMVDDAFGMIGITLVELLNSTQSGHFDEHVQALYNAIAIILSALIVTYIIRKALLKYERSGNTANLFLFAFAIPCMMIWWALYSAHLHVVLSYVPVIFMIPAKYLKKLEVGLVYLMFPIVGAFSYVTSAVEFSNFGLLTIILLISMFGMKFVAIGLVPIATRHRFSYLKKFTIGELLVAGFCSGICFKVGGLAAILIFDAHALGSALLATNMSIAIGMIGAVIFRFLPVFGINWKSKCDNTNDDLHAI